MKLHGTTCLLKRDLLLCPPLSLCCQQDCSRKLHSQQAPSLLEHIQQVHIQPRLRRVMPTLPSQIPSS